MGLEKFSQHFTISPDKIKKNPAKLGQAAFDILSKKTESQTVEETIDAMTPKYQKELEIAASLGSKEYNSPFYVVILRKKETVGGTLSNVLHHKYVRRQTKPKASFLRSEFPNSDHDVYEVNSNTQQITLIWTLPTKQDCLTILKNKQLYDPQLVKWIQDFDEGHVYLDIEISKRAANE
jgi:single-stranded DNA-specific DHH superfamily exonuclease